MPGRAAPRTMEETRAHERRQGWLEGYEACEQDHIQRALMKSELADQVLVERLAKVLAEHREMYTWFSQERAS